MKQSKVVKLADQLYFALDRARLQSFPVVAPLYVRFWRITVLRRYAANFRPPPERKLASGMAKAAFDGHCHGDIASGRRVLACVQSHTQPDLQGLV